MSKITAKDVQEIRDETSLGVMDIRNALEEADGNKEKALEILKSKAGDKMLKRAGRATSQGKVGVYSHGDAKSGCMVEVGCESDFVAKAEDFQNFVKELTLQVMAMKPMSVKELLEQDYVKDPKKKVSDLLKELIAKTGENIEIKRFVIYQMGADTISC
ncbi:MAG TPA: translation elongation factor Ts [Patescibacteria group bacterium]|nr:translation elongation factor Ts [Patescibacteria group bacterium]